MPRATSCAAFCSSRRFCATCSTRIAMRWYRRRASSVSSTWTLGNGTRTPSAPTSFNWSERLAPDIKMCNFRGSAFTALQITPRPRDTARLQEKHCLDRSSRNSSALENHLRSAVPRSATGRHAVCECAKLAAQRLRNAAAHANNSCAPILPVAFVCRNGVAPVSSPASLQS